MGKRYLYGVFWFSKVSLKTGEIGGVEIGKVYSATTGDGVFKPITGFWAYLNLGVGKKFLLGVYSSAITGDGSCILELPDPY